MSLEIKNLCINVTVASKADKEVLNIESIREDVLRECRQWVQETLSDSRER